MMKLPEEVELPEFPCRIRIIPSGRRSVGFHFDEGDVLIVRSPHRLSRKGLYDLIRSKRSWIIKSHAAIRESLLKVPTEWSSGTPLFYLGRSYMLQFAEGDKSLGVRISGDLLLVGDAERNRIQELLLEWYQRQAQDLIIPRVHEMASVLQTKFSTVRLTNARTRWGSCSARQKLNFSWRLILTPQHAIDYVIVHELVHLGIKNHGREFWRSVKKHCPDYAVSIEWLRRHEFFLSRYLEETRIRKGIDTDECAFAIEGDRKTLRSPSLTG